MPTITRLLGDAGGASVRCGVGGVLIHDTDSTVSVGAGGGAAVAVAAVDFAILQRVLRRARRGRPAGVGRTMTVALGLNLFGSPAAWPR